ncbi:MAG: N-acetylmuramoyl-L-alanine amidase LytC [Syntrophomonadaceae bacterium]|nr:N-acetylmuramoyl-L-alanine amidase LytC [Bacillota bacterium]
MRKRLPVLLSLLLFIVVLSAGFTVFAAARRTATVNVDTLNVRSGPGLQHSRISQVVRGNTVPVLTERTGWLEVRLPDGRSGWVAAQHVSVRENPAVSSTGGARAVVNVGVLNVRSGPAATFSRLTTAMRGSLLPILSRQGDWLQVRLPDGRNGWVAAQHTAIRNATQPVPAPAPAVQVPVPSVPASQPPVSGVPAPSGATGTVTVNVPVLNVRSGPDASFARLGTVSRGTRLSVQGSQGDWLQVRLPEGLSGWVFATYTGAGAPQPAPVASPAEQSPQLPETVPPDPSATPAGRLVSVAVDGSTVWSGPGFETRQISTLPQGTSLTVVNEQGDWLQVRLSGGELGWIASWLTTAGTTTAPQTPPTEPQPALQQPAQPSPLSGRTIVLDPGHGINPAHGNFSGAVGVTGLVEDVVVLDVSLQAAELLRQAGADVVLTRSDTTLALRQRVAIAEQARAHVFVSVHANAHLNRAVSGTETFYFQGKPNDTENYWLAAHLQNELVRALGLPDLGVKHGNFHVIRETTMPSALVELGFLSNAGDEALLRTAQSRAAAARAIFLALQRFFQT